VSFAAVSAFAYLAGLYVKAMLGGLTGDSIGAVGELVEIATLISVSALQRGFI
jgi:cobalamin synthase